MTNLAFIDGQNLYMNTKENSWAIDLNRFRIYLKERYDVETAYYFLGAVDESNHDLYEMIQKSGYILMFREHSKNMIGKKKGNVDTDIVFAIMSKIADNEEFDEIVRERYPIIKNGLFLGISPFELPASEYTYMLANLTGFVNTIDTHAYIYRRQISQ